ncbi:MAG: hypothetical protein NUV59_02365 [Patescibacteria group bacterium]|nr:hypothetical protein [Patescibacteria group bacterium]
MTLDVLIMLSGALVAAMPFLGFPTRWDTIILFILGVFVFALGVIVRRRGTARDRITHDDTQPPYYSEPQSGGGAA